MTAPRRNKLSKDDKIACLVRELFGVPYDDAKLMSANQVASLVEWDHYPHRHADGGPTVHWNTMPRLILAHREKTKADAADMAKERKVRRAEDLHEAKMVAKWVAFEDPAYLRATKPRARIPSRPFDKRHRPLRSRKQGRRS